MNFNLCINSYFNFKALTKVIRVLSLVHSFEHSDQLCTEIFHYQNIFLTCMTVFNEFCFHFFKHYIAPINSIIKSENNLVM